MKLQPKNWHPGMLLILFFSILLLGCGNPSHNNNNSNSSESWIQSDSPKAFVIGMQGESGVFGLIDVNTLKFKPSVGPVSNDAVARAAHGHVFVINRLTHDNIQVMEPPSFQLTKQFSVGSQTNPQDIIVLSTSKAYVSRLAEGKILIVNPLTGAMLGSIDLSSLSESTGESCQNSESCKSKSCINGMCAKDGIPEVATMYQHNSYIWVAVQRLNRNKRFSAEDKGLLAIIDTSNDKLLKTIETSGMNPYQFRAYQGTLYVSQPGNWMDGTKVVLDGQIESYDLATMKKVKTVLTEETLQGNLVSFVVLSETQGYVIRSGQNWKTELLRFNPKTGQLGTVLKVSKCVANNACYSFVGMDIHSSGKLFLMDRDPKNPGVRVFDTNTDKELTTTPLHIGLPPMSVTFY